MSGLVRKVYETRWDDLSELEERHAAGFATPEDECQLLRLQMGDDQDD